MNDCKRMRRRDKDKWIDYKGHGCEIEGRGSRRHATDKGQVRLMRHGSAYGLSCEWTSLPIEPVEWADRVTISLAKACARCCVHHRAAMANTVALM